MMNRTLVCGALGLTLSSAAALAADIPAKAPIYKSPAAVAVENWQGFYAGAAIGYAWQKDGLDETLRGTEIPSGFTPIEAKPEGVKLGGFAGHNWQYGAAVFGLEGDFEWANVGWGRAFYVGSSDNYAAKTSWQASVRGRLGYSTGPALLYVTGGAAFADIKYEYVDSSIPVTESHSSVRVGWTVGGGVDWRFAPNWFARVEYRYADFGTEDNSPSVFGNSFDEHHSTTEHAVRLGVAYKFGR